MNFNEIAQYTSEGNWCCDYSIDSFVKEISNFIKEDGLELRPDFQRDLVWSEEQQVAFVENILKGGKNGNTIYLNDNTQWVGDKKIVDFVCVDGLQRITALTRFVNNEIKVFGLYRREFKGSSRCVQSMKININNLKTRKEVLKWYLEINNSGTPHTQEELQMVEDLYVNCK